jgi:nucleoid-associated protein YejK
VNISKAHLENEDNIRVWRFENNNWNNKLEIKVKNLSEKIKSQKEQEFTSKTDEKGVQINRNIVFPGLSMDLFGERKIKDMKGS